MSNKNKNAHEIAQAHRTANEIVSAAIGLAAMTAGGYWLDRRQGWAPVLTVLGALLGLLSAGFSLRNLIRRLDRESDREKAKSKLP